MRQRLVRVCAALVLLALGVVLSGCATSRMIDSEVRSFPGAAPALTGVEYRFERLPSQQEGGPFQDRIEDLAAQALARIGLTRTDGLARYAVQVSVRVDQYARNPQRRLQGNDLFVGFGVAPWNAPAVLMLEPPWYLHTVQVLVRDTASGQLAYETTAAHDGPWSDTLHLLPAIFEAALRDYPTPPKGPRKVVVEVPPHPQDH
ncbi:MAG: hypothetical protein RLZZ573_1717 [Pseudomonadota bacterium]|jgi:hypothetical protein